MLVVTGTVTIGAGLLLLLDAQGSIELLRSDLRRRGRTGFVVEWPDYFWRSLGFALTLMGLVPFVGGWGAILAS